jgi:hypothetical protein
LPASGINALGWVYVCGLSFVPAPATGIIAFIDHCLDGSSRNRTHGHR